MTIGASTVALAATKSPSRRTSNQSSSGKHAYYDYGRGGDRDLLAKRQKTNGALASNTHNAHFPSTPTKSYRRYNGSPCVTPKKTPGKGSCDRFIPNRSSFRVDLCSASVFCAEEEEQQLKSQQHNREGKEPNQSTGTTTPIRAEFQRRMRRALLSISDEDLESRASTRTAQSCGRDIPRVRRLLSFNNEREESLIKNFPVMDPFQQDQLHVLDRSQSNIFADEALNTSSRSQRKTSSSWRKIPSGPSRVLDAPDLEDDYYLNLLSWGKGNVLAVALGRNVYLWDASNSDIHHLVSLEGSDNYVTSVSWAEMAGYTHFLGVGTHDGLVQLYVIQNLPLIFKIYLTDIFIFHHL